MAFKLIQNDPWRALTEQPILQNFPALEHKHCRCLPYLESPDTLHAWVHPLLKDRAPLDSRTTPRATKHDA